MPSLSLPAAGNGLGRCPSRQPENSHSFGCPSHWNMIHIITGHELVCRAGFQMAVCSHVRRVPAGYGALVVFARPGRNLLFRFLFPRFPDPGIDWPPGNFTRGLLPSGCCPFARTVGAGVVRADAALVFERAGDADWTLLGGNARVGTVASQPVAPRDARDLLPW